MKYASAKLILLINTTDMEWYHYTYAVTQVRQHADKWLAQLVTLAAGAKILLFN
jgi:hypothetical protein